MIFNWTAFLARLIALFLSTAGFALDGNQVLHTRPNNKSYQRDPLYIQFVETTFQNAIALGSDAEVLRYASDHVTVDGLFVELGTGKGRTTNFIAALNPHKILYTFDSYLGHLADWDKGDKIMTKDFFAWPENEKLPQFLLNVVLTKGWFADTLSDFAKQQEKPIAFLHVDCEIYESTSQALIILGPKIADGTVFLFDEFYNYPNFRNHEYKAFQEFLNDYGFKAEYLAYNALHEQVAVRVKKVDLFSRDKS